MANRCDAVGGGLGSIARFVRDQAGNYVPNGSITGNDLEAVHGLAFSPSGELFAANLLNGHISRFLFDARGNAIRNGVLELSMGNLLGLAFDNKGELLVTNADDLIYRYVFDPITGEAIFHGRSRLGIRANTDYVL